MLNATENKKLNALTQCYFFRPMQNASGKYVLAAFQKTYVGQPFWFSAYEYANELDTYKSPDLLSEMGPRLH